MIASAKNAESVARREREEEERLVAADADAELDEDEVTTDVFEVDISGGSSPWATTFLECASEGDLATVTKLLDDGKVDLNDVDVDGFTALMIAAAEAQTDVAMFLLSRGADVSIRTHEMRSTALHFAAKSGEARVVEAICKQDPQRVDAQNLDGDTPLVWACTEGRADAVRALLAHNANVNVVSHRAMSVLICAVMLRGRDASELEDDESEGDDDDEPGVASDTDRAEIVRMLLAKNPKLVNYQDRDGSTAMHLAASHGYIKCVKALLEFGADITLRNAIGQTALEEAEETGVGPTSDLCVQYLRIIWKRLEEEAAARMMAMLEMEEAAPSSSNSNSKSAKKGAKKKSKKAKQKRGSKTTTAASANAAATDKATDDDDKAQSSGEGSSEDEDQVKPSAPAVVDSSKELVAVKNTEQQESQVHESDNALQDGGVWTTVGRKHHQYLAQRAAEASSDTQETSAHQQAPPARTATKHGEQASTAPQKKTRPVTPPRPPVTPPRPETIPPPPGASFKPLQLPPSTPVPSAASKVTPRAGKESPTGPASKIVPVSPRSSKRGSQYTAVDSVTAVPTVTPPAPVSRMPTSPPPLGSPFSTFQSLHHSNRLYERYEVPDRARPASSSTPLASSLWRSSSTVNPRLPSDEAPTFSLTTSTTTQSPPSTIWRYASPLTQPVSVDRSLVTSRRWTPSSMAERSREDELRRFLECGLCGELVNDNRQCSTTQPSRCLQLYCIGCLVRATASPASSFQCVKCRRPVDPRTMERNELVQAQAATWGLAAQRASSHLHKTSAIEEMKRLLQHCGDRIQTLDIDPVALVPGANLSSLSVGQLDALEDLHLQALQQITQARIENARAIERLRIEEYLKTQQDLFQFTPQR